MAVTETIQELLQGIDEAQYGRDMRQFIHKAIQKCYEEGSAGETDLVARNGILKILEMFGNVETGTTASRAYSIGDTVVYDGRLYKVLAAIAQGDTFTVDTNIEEISASGATMSPPDFSAMETATEWRNQSSYFTVDYAITKNGWYSLEIYKQPQAQSPFTYGQANVYLSPHYENTRPVALISNYDSGYSATPWMYFMAGNVIRIACSAEDAFLRYAPCL